MTKITNKKFITTIIVIAICVFIYVLYNEVLVVNYTIPDIVFLESVSFEQMSEDIRHKRVYYFYDKKGNYYKTKDGYYDLPYIDDFLNMYKNGKLDDKIELLFTCDEKELLRNYRKVMAIKNKDIDIITPRECPQVQVVLHNSYAILSDKTGEIGMLCIHQVDRCGDLETDNKITNEVYKWWADTIEKDAISKDKSRQISAWAKTEVENAIDNNLIRAELKRNYTQNITRGDFAKLIVDFIQLKTGKYIGKILSEQEGISYSEILKKEAFNDTDDRSVVAAKVLGVMDGVSLTRFDPNASITREQAANVIYKTANYLGKDLKRREYEFKDDEQVSDWAKEGVNFISRLGEIEGVHVEKFEPKSNYTREQAYVIVYRLFQELK